MKRPYGKINIVTVVILAALAIGLWLLITLGPAYMDNLDVKEAVAQAINQVPLGTSDEGLQRGILDRLRSVGDHLADDGYGTITRQPGLGITNDDIVIERDEVHSTATITVSYTRVMDMKPLKKQRKIPFVVRKTGPLKR